MFFPETWDIGPNATLFNYILLMDTGHSIGRTGQQKEFMEQNKDSILDNFLNQFNGSHTVNADPSYGRDGSDAGSAASSHQTTRRSEGPMHLTGDKTDAPLSEDQSQQIEFCQLLWDGASEKVTKANSEAAVKGAADDPAFREEDIALRQKILEQLKNPNVNFRNFALLVYRWRDMHLNRVIPKKQTLGIPLWQAPSCGTRGEDEETHES